MSIRKNLTIDIMGAIRNEVLLAENCNNESMPLSNFTHEIEVENFYIEPAGRHKPEYEYALKAIEKEGYIKIESGMIYFIRYIFS